MPPKSLITQQPVNPAKLQRAKDMRREPTPAERKLWSRLRAGRLVGIHFRRQQIIGPYIVDFYCHQARLVIEVDGEIHLQQQEYDQQREQMLQSHGLRVMRFSNTEINQNIEGVLAEILRTCTTATNKEQNQEGEYSWLT
jgi:very-short-patch-repair endonuclease